MYGEIIVMGGKLGDGTVDQCLYLLQEVAKEAWDE
jgi:hypothetical protein